MMYGIQRSEVKLLKGQKPEVRQQKALMYYWTCESRF